MAVLAAATALAACGGAGTTSSPAAPTGTPITVATATIEAPAEVRAGAELIVSWTSTSTRRSDSILVVPKGTTVVPENIARDASFNTNLGSPFTWKAPATPGDYELWYVSGDETGVSILARLPIKVT